MKPRIRKLSNLYHRWGKRLGMDAESVARALVARGLIERIGTDKYRERDFELTTKQTRELWDNYVLKLLRESRHG